ncbi:hypothetical protein MTR67_019140 [Solanum verrucosum]|uniref:Tf2-1-like SH3-like domain-containing protein n=1 Tax=Solanum verrucosum TaxID=315347 RepID=A0AAF0QR84_SOLVR|nr:hypothetical protein MTR67_019140 [Solanum verrucosum]
MLSSLLAFGELFQKSWALALTLAQLSTHILMSNRSILSMFFRTYCGRDEIREASKLSPMYIGPFEILQIVVEVPYELALPPMFSAIHVVFHVSMLHHYVPDVFNVLQYDAVELDDRLTFAEELVVVLARDVW